LITLAPEDLARSKQYVGRVESARPCHDYHT
jgi:hypothetical protein